jgi:hypothetical protein
MLNVSCEFCSVYMNTLHGNETSNGLYNFFCDHQMQLIKYIGLLIVLGWLNLHGRLFACQYLFYNGVTNLYLVYVFLCSYEIIS